MANEMEFLVYGSLYEPIHTSKVELELIFKLNLRCSFIDLEILA
jgi:hypothetical protein